MRPLLRRAFPFFLAAASGLGLAACGAGISAVYESDVRFEHCMALDADPAEQLATRKGCWDEWVEYYTFGQTRDRVDYARRRRAQLARPDHGDVAEPALAHREVPEPTDVLAPPPMILSDAGRSSEADAGADAPPDAPEPPGAECARQCSDTWGSCKGACATPACEKTCVTRYKGCMRRCF